MSEREGEAAEMARQMSQAEGVRRFARSVTAGRVVTDDEVRTLAPSNGGRWSSDEH